MQRKNHYLKSTLRQHASGITLGLCAAMFVISGCDDPKTAQAAQDDQIAANVCADPLASAVSLNENVGNSLDQEALRRFYETDPTCMWSDSEAESLLLKLADAQKHGLEPKDYHIDALASAELTRSQRELLLTDAAFRYAQDMTTGRINLAAVEKDVDYPQAVSDPVSELRAADADNSVTEWLDGIQPRQAQYGQLLATLQQYRELDANGGWGQLPTLDKSLKPGETSDLVASLRHRLMAEGYEAESASPLNSKEEKPDIYEGEVVTAVEQFQLRNGLKPDGVIGKKTLATLNITPAQRVQQIEANLERWRIMSRSMEPTRLEVNIPSARATLLVDDQVEREMTVVVGQKKTPTPILHSAIYMVVVNPSWRVPVSITRNEIVPKLRADPGYMKRKNMYWSDGGGIVQAPGEGNALGRIKFELKNSFSVYMHDTSDREAFARDQRNLSHGCVRVENPINLAERLIGDSENWNVEKIDETIASGATTRVRISTPMPVHFAYWTSFVDDSGAVNFRDDIYGRDGRAIIAIEQRKRIPIKSPEADQKLAALGETNAPILR